MVRDAVNHSKTLAYLYSKPTWSFALMHKIDMRWKTTKWILTMYGMGQLVDF